MGILIHTKLTLLEKGTGLPLQGPSILVKLMDKDVLVDDFLGEATPDAKGLVAITFDLDAIKSADSKFEELPDLYFKVFKNGTEYFNSPVTEDLDTTSEGEFNFKDGKVIDLGTYSI